MYYNITAPNADGYLIWSPREDWVELYVDELNRGREFDLFSARRIPSEEWTQDLEDTCISWEDGEPPHIQ